MNDAQGTEDAGRQARGTARRLPTVTLGFIPLTDCAVLAVARERGFAADEGIDLQLSREVSWANIRDNVALGHLQGAQMLAGMPIAAALGINQIRTPMIVPFCLNRNGNAISVSNGLYAEMARLGDLDRDARVAAAGEALRRVITARRSAGSPPLTFGMVYPFSCHNYELRYWMAACGIDPDGDVRLVVIPPPLMVDSLRDGHVDGFCVGEPWNSVAVQAGLGRIIVSKAELWQNGMEKVLGVPEIWASENAGVLAALIRALDRAAAWADEPANRSQLAALLAAPDYLDMPAGIVARALAGEMSVGPAEELRTVADFLILHRDGANRPSIDQALWIYSQMVRWGQVARKPADEAITREIFSADLYDRALGLQPPAAGAAAAGILGPEVFFDGHVFDPRRIDDYLGDLPGTSRFAEVEPDRINPPKI
jgi:two-component system, oxyanion-binding sensor